jgi:hypothetical protein
MWRQAAWRITRSRFQEIEHRAGLGGKWPEQHDGAVILICRILNLMHEMMR